MQELIELVGGENKTVRVSNVKVSKKAELSFKLYVRAKPNSGNSGKVWPFPVFLPTKTRLLFTHASLSPKSITSLLVDGLDLFQDTCYEGDNYRDSFCHLPNPVGELSLRNIRVVHQPS